MIVYCRAIVGRISGSSQTSEATFPKYTTSWSVLERWTEDTYFTGVIPGYLGDRYNLL